MDKFNYSTRLVKLSLACIPPLNLVLSVGKISRARYVNLIDPFENRVPVNGDLSAIPRSAGTRVNTYGEYLVGIDIQKTEIPLIRGARYRTSTTINADTLRMKHQPLQGW